MSLIPKPTKRYKPPKLTKQQKQVERKYNIETAVSRLDEALAGINKVRAYKGQRNVDVLDDYLTDLKHSIKGYQKALKSPSATSKSVDKARVQVYYFEVIDPRHRQLGAGSSKGAITRSRNKISDLIHKNIGMNITVAGYYKKQVFPIKPYKYGAPYDKAMDGYKRPSDGKTYKKVPKQFSDGRKYMGYDWA